ncbi:S8 family serine peptidase [Candidatus Altiarchaeota archaeon]
MDGKLLLPIFLALLMIPLCSGQDIPGDQTTVPDPPTTTSMAGNNTEVIEVSSTSSSVSSSTSTSSSSTQTTDTTLGATSSTIEIPESTTIPPVPEISTTDTTSTTTIPVEISTTTSSESTSTTSKAAGMAAMLQAQGLEDKAGPKLLALMGGLDDGDETRIVVRMVNEQDLGEKLGRVGKAGYSAIRQRTELIDVRRRAVKRVSDRVIARIDASNFKLNSRGQIVNMMVGNATLEGILEILSDPEVEAVSLDEPVKALMDESVIQINATAPWSKYINGRNFTGRQETVCVIDSGIRYTHEALGNEWGNKVLGGYDYVNGDSNPWDDNGHGTHCAGTVASTDDTWKGVAPDANLIAIKALDWDGTGYMSDVEYGIEWCTTNQDLYNISVITISIGSDTKFTSACDSDGTAWVVNLKNAVNAAYNAGIFIAASSGNEAYVTQMSAPACYNNVVSVGAVYDYDGGELAWSSCTDSAANVDVDKVICISNRPSFLDVWAPGYSITSTYSTSDTAFTSMGGTSMACPHVAGAAAVLQQFNKDWKGVPLTPAQIKTLLVDNGKLITRNVERPRIDVWKAILDITSGNTVPTLSNAGVSPTEHLDSTTFYFNVTYTDAQNNTPDNLTVTISGTGYGLSGSDAADVNKVDGKDYYYAATLSRGSYEYQFSAGDGFLTTNTSLDSNPTVTSAPTLASIQVTPSMGEPSELFNFTVTYTDADDDPEGYVNLSLDGVIYAMDEADPADTDYTDGKVYYVNITGLGAGGHAYSVIGKDDRAYGSGVSSSESSGPDVNTSASCTGDSPPGIGSASDWDVTQETVCSDSAFIPSTEGTTILQELLALNNVTVYAETDVIEFTGGLLRMNDSILRFTG